MDHETVDKVAKNNRCHSIQDFMKPAARQLIRFYCEKFLIGRKISVVELLHSQKHQKVFTDAGSIMNNAVQKIAIAQVKDLKEDVQDRIKALNKLCDELIKKTWEYDKEEKIPVIQPDAKEAGLIEFLALKDKTETSFLCFAALANYIFEEKTLMDKVNKVFSLLKEDTHPDLVRFIDCLIGDLLSNPMIWNDCFENSPNLSEKVWALMNMIEGKDVEVTDPPPAMEKVREIFKNPALSLSKGALTEQLMHYVTENTLLLDKKAPVLEEVKETAHLLRRMEENEENRYSSELQELVSKRISKHYQYEVVHAYLKELSPETEKVNACLGFYKHSVKATDREVIVNLLKSIFERIDPLKELRDIQGDAKAKIAKITNTYLEVKKSNLPEAVRNMYTTKVEQTLKSSSA